MNFHINSWRKNIVRLRAHHLITNTLRFRSYIYFDKNERNKTATFHEILCLTYCEADVVVVAIVLSLFSRNSVLFLVIVSVRAMRNQKIGINLGLFY